MRVPIALLCRSRRLLARRSSGSQAGCPAGGCGPGAAAEGEGRTRGPARSGLAESVARFCGWHAGPPWLKALNVTEAVDSVLVSVHA